MAGDIGRIDVDSPATTNLQREAADLGKDLLTKEHGAESDSGYYSESAHLLTRPRREVQERDTKILPVSLSSDLGFTYGLKDIHLSRSSCSSDETVGGTVCNGAVDFRAENTGKSIELQNQRYSQSPILPDLLKFSRKTKPRLTAKRRTLSHVQLAKVTRPIEYFSKRTELMWLFRSFFKTIITLRDHGIEHRNISLENLAIAPRPRLFGKGVITSYDDLRDSSRQLKPRFVYTMTSRHMLTDLVHNPKRHNSLESLLLCLLWIVTTRSGAKNQKREGGFLRVYNFSQTELYKWHRRDWYDESCVREQSSRKLSVMTNKTRFDDRVLGDIHPHFNKLKDFLRVLRALIYDPQWEETRNLLGDPDPAKYLARRSLIEMYTCIIEDASRMDPTALDRALATEPARSDKSTVIGAYTQLDPEVSKFVKEGLNEERIEAVKKALGILSHESDNSV
ncbi:hypothetical protein ACEPAI_9498 [Sanghuangporus weigelae]